MSNSFRPPAVNYFDNCSRLEQRLRTGSKVLHIIQYNLCTDSLGMVSASAQEVKTRFPCPRPVRIVLFGPRLF